MAMYILRKLYNGTVCLFAGALVVITMYAGGALLLAAFFGTQLMVMPVAGQWIPESANPSLVMAGWLIFSVGCFFGLAMVLAMGITRLIRLLDVFQQKVSITTPVAV